MAEPNRPSDLALERALTEGAPLPDHPDNAGRFERMRATGDEYMNSAAAARLRVALRERQQARRPWRLGLWLGAPMLAGAVVVLLLVLPAGESDVLVAKGGGILEAVNAEGEVTAARVGQPVQLVWTSAEPGHLGLVGRGSDGVVVELQPVTRIGAGRRVPIGDALALDAPDPLFEVWAYFAPDPFELPEPGREFAGETVHLSLRFDE